MLYSERRYVRFRLPYEPEDLIFGYGAKAIRVDADIEAKQALLDVAGVVFGLVVGMPVQMNRPSPFTIPFGDRAMEQDCPMPIDFDFEVVRLNPR